MQRNKIKKAEKMKEKYKKRKNRKMQSAKKSLFFYLEIEESLKGILKFRFHYELFKKTSLIVRKIKNPCRNRFRNAKNDHFFRRNHYQ